MAVKKKLSELPVLRHYDKLLVVLALVVLLVSLAYLVTAGMARDEERGDSSRYAQEIKRLADSPSRVEAIDMTVYENATRQLKAPFAIPTENLNREQANFLTPECRVACVNTACEKPIPEKAAICPFCGQEQQKVREVNATFSTLNDGVPDVFKRQYGINIREVGAADADMDGDGFTLREEYEAGTDPTDPNSRPPYTAKLQLTELRGKKLPLIFTAVNRMPDGNQLTFNWTDPRARRTYWVRENQPIGETGYTAGLLTVKEEERDTPAGRRRVDVSTAVVKRDSDGKEIELQIGEKEQNTDVEAIFVFLVDNSELTLLENEEFKLRDETYRVVSINEKDGDGTVVVVDASDGDKQKTFKKSP